MEPLVALFAIASYTAFVWFLWGKQIKSWFLWLLKRVTERADETARLNRMWDLNA